MDALIVTMKINDITMPIVEVELAPPDVRTTKEYKRGKRIIERWNKRKDKPVLSPMVMAPREERVMVKKGRKTVEYREMKPFGFVG